MLSSVQLSTKHGARIEIYSVMQSPPEKKNVPPTYFFKEANWDCFNIKE